MAIQMVMFPGRGEERAYLVRVYIDGRLFHEVTVDARSSVDAAVRSYALAMHEMIGALYDCIERKEKDNAAGQ